MKRTGSVKKNRRLSTALEVTNLPLKTGREISPLSGRGWATNLLEIIGAVKIGTYKKTAVARYKSLDGLLTAC